MRRLAYAKHKHVISGVLRHAHMQSLGRLINEDGTPNKDVIRKSVFILSDLLLDVRWVLVLICFITGCFLS